jgi:hypothetical protein
MTVRTAELLMGLTTLLISLGIMWSVVGDDLNIGWVKGRGPGAGMWPFWLAVGMALASLATLARWVQRATPESRSGEPYIDRDTLFLVFVTMGALLAMILLIGVVGMYLAFMAFLAFYLRVIGRHGWGIISTFVLATPIFIYLLFEVALTKYLPKGLPVFEDAFLVIDDLRYSLF